MKQFREFSSQQQHINEIGPVGATIAGVMGLIGGAMALSLIHISEPTRPY